MSAVPLGRIPVGPLLPFLTTTVHNRYNPSRQGRRDPFEPADDSGSPYRLNKSVRRAALAVLRDFPSRESAYRLLTFLGRFQAHPENLGRLFPVDRRALAGHKALGLSENQVRGGLKALEQAGVLIRAHKERKHAYQRTAEGLRRTPIQFSFSPLFHSLFVALNRWKSLKDRKSQSRSTRPAVCTPEGPKAKLYNKIPKVLFLGGKRTVSEKVTVIEAESPLEKAIAALRKAIIPT